MNALTEDLDAQRSAILERLTFRPADEATRYKLAAIPWPAGLAPYAESQPRGMALPECDAVIVTWTAAEAKALSNVLTPWVEDTGWIPYTHRFETFYRPLIRLGAPALEAGRLGAWQLIGINGRKVLLMKSDLHMSQDGPQLPVLEFWKQLAAETKAKLIITTGTAGAIGARINLGDVIVTQRFRFDCQREFKSQPWAQTQYSCATPVPRANALNDVEALLTVNAGKLAPQSTVQPRVLCGGGNGIVTTDFFAFDDSTNQYGLQPLGSAVEMGDAVLALACEQIGAGAPAWIGVRNASDPQIDGTLPLEQQRAEAGRIYQHYGYWTTVGSAIVSALIAGAA